MKTFAELANGARNSAVYHLEGVALEIGEQIVDAKDKLRRTAYWNTDKKVRLVEKLRTLRHCHRIVEAEMDKLKTARRGEVR